VEYTGLVEWLSKELKTLCKLDEHVNAVSSAEDSSSFLLELSSFLKELGKYTENYFVLGYCMISLQSSTLLCHFCAVIVRQHNFASNGTF
jgi:hypothetical protein